MNFSETNAIQALDVLNGQPPTLIEAAYRQLRRDIIDGWLVPGEKLRVEHLKDRYNVSSGTLREALALLVSDSLVVAQGQRGFSVAPMSLTDLEDLTRMRILLECEALRESMARGTDDWEAKVISAFHKLTLAEQRLVANAEDTFDYWEKCNRSFHDAILSGCQSVRLLHSCHVLYSLSERYRRISATQGPPPVGVHDEHQALCEAVLARKEEDAVSVLISHTQRALVVSRTSGLLA